MCDVVVDYRSVGVAGSLAGGRLTTGSRQRDTSGRDTRGSTHSAAGTHFPAKPLLLAYLLYSAVAAATASTAVTCHAVAARARKRPCFL